MYRTLRKKFLDIIEKIPEDLLDSVRVEPDSLVRLSGELNTYTVVPKGSLEILQHRLNDFIDNAGTRTQGEFISLLSAETQYVSD